MVCIIDESNESNESNETTMKKFKMNSGAYGFRKFDYNGQIWLTNGHAMVDIRFVSLGRKKIESVEFSPTKGSNIEMVMQSYDNVNKFGRPLNEVSRETVKEKWDEFEVNRLKIGFQKKVEVDEGDPTIPIILFIDGNYNSWFADMTKVEECELISYGDCCSPIFLVNHFERQVIGCVMPLRY